MNGITVSAKNIGVERDLAFTMEDFSRIASFLHDSTGIRLSDANEPMVFSRLAGRIRALGFDSFSTYLDMAWNSRSADERDHLISALTTNTTHFFREKYHFDILCEDILPDLIKRARAGDRIRIWSAACSSGEEAYSIALCIFRAFPDVLSHNVRILATDVDQEILKRAEAGSYLTTSVQDIPQQYLDIGFDATADQSRYIVKSGIRDLVSFRRLNLIQSWPFSGKFDLIFCRNVAIYMDLETQTKIWNGFRLVLRQGGYLFIGHSERLSPSTKEYFELVGNTAYKMINPNNKLDRGRNTSADRGY
ncbi:CheR family methyltransferase [Roseicitreum antarcticum]|uniref:Chemotaxis protein methyltransferase n=1 Tax=Roseicitreum antarcticum TaxID=564137 RepID=A0A1H3AUI9_9RHOB|nr:protein-glutamate O-methyltransferase [Roseicitreum antarcticum]SDX32509.1 chemotaxis protein methyltransferase CheR [Roseicitreum antarcticum]